MPEPEMDQPKEWRPSNNEVLGQHDIIIQFLSRGCVIRVGCKSIAFEDVHQAMRKLENMLIILLKYNKNGVKS